MTHAASQEVIRRSFGLKEKIKPLLAASYHSSLVERIKASDYRLRTGSIEFRLAREFGFCYGVDRAVDLAYETRERFPEKKIYLTSEIIHNPRVNQKLQELGIEFLDQDLKHGAHGGSVSLDRVTERDVVLIPAFGTPTRELELLKSKGCILVDTTCGSVVAVWRRVEQYAKNGFTSIIHGKFHHEETRATSSRVTQFPDGKFLVVKDKKQALKICDFILGKSARESFLDEFSATASPGFDPSRDLERIGCANQTTMLSSESLEISERIKSAIQARWGEAELPNRFRHFDTICSATQDRQDAVLELARSGVDLLVIAGGYNSSNTGHLCEISSEACPAYHVRDAEEIISKFEIRHKLPGRQELDVTRDWLPLEKPKLAIGITAGASTPDRIIEEVIFKITGLLGHALKFTQ